MIFKYFTYDKIAKDWVDTKSYFSICIPENTKDKNLRSLIYSKLILNKKISMPLEFFSLNDSSTYANIKTYTISIVKNNKKWYVCRLTQLPDKENAVNNSKIKSSWNNILFSSSVILATPRVAPRGVRNDIFGDPWIRPANPSWTISMGAQPVPAVVPNPAPEPVAELTFEQARIYNPNLLGDVEPPGLWDDEDLWAEEHL